MEPMRHNWSCEETEAQLTEYLDGTLAASTRAQVEAHVASCAGCASMIANVGGLLRRLARLEPVAEPPNLASAILAATLGPRRGKSDWKAWSGWLRPFFAAALCLWGSLCDGHGSRAFPGTRDTLARSGDCGSESRKPRPRGKPRSSSGLRRGMKVVSDLRLVYEIQTRPQPANETEQTTESPAETPVEAIPSGHTAPQRLINPIDHNFPALHQASLKFHPRQRRSFE